MTLITETKLGRFAWKQIFSLREAVSIWSYEYENKKQDLTGDVVIVVGLTLESAQVKVWNHKYRTFKVQYLGSDLRSLQMTATRVSLSYSSWRRDKHRHTPYIRYESGAKNKDWGWRLKSGACHWKEMRLRGEVQRGKKTWHFHDIDGARMPYVWPKFIFILASL